MIKTEPILYVYKVSTVDKNSWDRNVYIIVAESLAKMEEILPQKSVWQQIERVSVVGSVDAYYIPKLSDTASSTTYAASGIQSI